MFGGVAFSKPWCSLCGETFYPDSGPARPGGSESLLRPVLRADLLSPSSLARSPGRERPSGWPCGLRSPASSAAAEVQVLLFRKVFGPFLSASGVGAGQGQPWSCLTFTFKFINLCLNIVKVRVCFYSVPALTSCSCHWVSVYGISAGFLTYGDGDRTLCGESACCLSVRTDRLPRVRGACV